MDIDSWLRRLSLLFLPEGVRRKRGEVSTGRHQGIYSDGLVSALDSLSNVTRSQTKVLPLPRDSSSLFFYWIHLHLKACVPFQCGTSKSQAAVLHNALSTSQCHHYSVDGNIHNSFKYYSLLPFGVWFSLKMVQDYNKSSDPRTTFDCLPLCDHPSVYNLLLCQNTPYFFLTCKVFNHFFL